MEPDRSPSDINAHGLKARATFAPLVFATLTLLMFFDLLVTNQRVISSEDADLAMQFIPWRQFGFEQLRHGNLALWNPHIFGGTPYFAGFQSALLYPPNWLHLILPVGLAINWIVALHVFCAGYFTYLWCRGRAISVEGSILAGVMFMFAGPYFFHLYAGHLPHLAVMVWTPLMVLSIDKLADTGGLHWCLLGLLTTAMHILAGHPQYVYYTGIVLTLYVALRLSAAAHRLKLLAGFVVMYVGAVLLTAIQLLPGIQAAGEQVRSGGTSFEFASMFSLPPQNLITLLAPTFFGNVTLDPNVPMDTGYFGACYLWEVSLFVSVTGLVLALLGAVRNSWRITWIPLVLVLITLLLALGRHTPLYRPMFNLLPAYSSFRGTVKFAYLSVLFISLLAAMGFDSIQRDRKAPAWFCAIVGGLSILIWICGMLLPRGEAWARFLQWMSETARRGQPWTEWYAEVPLGEPGFWSLSAGRAASACFLAGATLGAVALLLLLARRHRLVPFALIVLAAGEMFVFARFTRATMDLTNATALPEPWRAPVQQLSPDQRLLTVPPRYANLGMAIGFENLYGYDPGVLKRYAETVFASQGANPADAKQYLPWQRVSVPVFRMLRCALVCFDPKQKPVSAPAPLPLAVLISDWIKLDSRDLILSYITQPTFDPATTVVLETDPGIKTIPAAAAPGTVKATRQGTDRIDLDAIVQRPAVLLVTTNYSTGWRIKPLQGSQGTYSILPANWTLIGIPLQPGQHRLVLEYSPAAFRIGAWVSIFALSVLLCTSILLMRRRRWFR